jgi:hypothetical protein
MVFDDDRRGVLHTPLLTLLDACVLSWGVPTGGIVGNDNNAMYVVGHYNKHI